MRDIDQAAVSRRAWLGGVAGMVCAGGAARVLPLADDLPKVDLHAHLDRSTIEQVAALGRERRVRFGIVEHAGTEANVYPVVLSSDAELIAYADMLEGHGVFKGVQTEWRDWRACFSREALARLDYVLTDAMTMPAPDGSRVKMWEAGALERTGLTDPGAFMDRYVAWHVEILDGQPIDLLANVSWLPEAFASRYDALWTDARIDTVVEAARRNGVALEISASYRIPSLAFLKRAKAAGLKFAFGSNGRYPEMGKLDYSLETARTLGLTPADLFVPAGARAGRA